MNIHGQKIRETNVNLNELAAAQETLQGHLRCRQELEDYGKRGDQVGPGGRPIWADSGRKRRGGHLS